MGAAAIRLLLLSELGPERVNVLEILEDEVKPLNENKFQLLLNWMRLNFESTNRVKFK